MREVDQTGVVENGLLKMCIGLAPGADEAFVIDVLEPPLRAVKPVLNVLECPLKTRRSPVAKISLCRGAIPGPEPQIRGAGASANSVRWNGGGICWA